MSTDLLFPSAATSLALAFSLTIAALVGFAFGARRAARARRAAQRTLAERELELLEARADATRLNRALVDSPRRERVLRLALERLRDAKARERRRFVDVTTLRLALVEADTRTKEAVRLAESAAHRVRELEENALSTGTITTRAPKSYGSGESVTVSVVEHETAEARSSGATHMPPRDRARLARVASSNEARCREGALECDRHGGTATADGVRARVVTKTDELSVIDGLAADDADRLAAHGIHRLEQLASLTENELHGLVGASDGQRWIGDARALLDERTNT